LSSLLMVPDNSSCCLPGCTLYTGVPIQYPVRDFATGVWLGGKVPINIDLSSCWSLITAAASLGARFILGSQSSILLGILQQRGSRGKVPINIDLSSLLLVPDNSSCCCLPGCAQYTRVPIQYHVRDFKQRARLGARSQSLTCRLLLVPNNSSCCLPECTLILGSQSSILLGISQQRGLRGARSQY
jgi:hypothetical protein